MDNDGKDEYVFVNYATNFATWADDAYVWVIEIDVALDVNETPMGVPTQLELAAELSQSLQPDDRDSLQPPGARTCHAQGLHDTR